MYAVGDLAVHAVAARGLLLVVVLHRVGRAGSEVELLVVRTVVVRLPDGGVVHRPVRRRDRVLQRPLERRRAGDRRGGVLVGVVRVPLVAELGQYDEDPVGLLPGQLDVLVDLALSVLLALGAAGLGAELHHRAGAALLRLASAVQQLRQGFLAELAALVLQRAGQVVGGRHFRGFRRRSGRIPRRCGATGRGETQADGRRQGQA